MAGGAASCSTFSFEKQSSEFSWLVWGRRPLLCRPQLPRHAAGRFQYRRGLNALLVLECSVFDMLAWPGDTSAKKREKRKSWGATTTTSSTAKGGKLSPTSLFVSRRKTKSKTFRTHVTHLRRKQERRNRRRCRERPLTHFRRARERRVKRKRESERAKRESERAKEKRSFLFSLSLSPRLARPPRCLSLSRSSFSLCFLSVINIPYREKLITLFLFAENNSKQDVENFLLRCDKKQKKQEKTKNSRGKKKHKNTPDRLKSGHLDHPHAALRVVVHVRPSGSLGGRAELGLERKGGRDRRC